jgi:hypothetical protein
LGSFGIGSGVVPGVVCAVVRSGVGDDVMDVGYDTILCKRTAASGIDFYYDEAAGTLFKHRFIIWF